MPPSISEKYNLKLPDYGFGSNQIVIASQNNGKVATQSVDLTIDTNGGGVRTNSTDIVQYSTVFVTASSMEEAKKISSKFLNSGIVACVNIIPTITSMYIWEGKLEETGEIMMIVKVRNRGEFTLKFPLNNFSTFYPTARKIVNFMCIVISNIVYSHCMTIHG